MRFIRHTALGATLALSSLCTLAQTTATDAWVRGTVPQQKATGAFMKLTSASGGKLVSASSPAAGVTEVHEMAMDGNTMKMRALANGLELPAGKTVELRPGSYHVMLMDLKAPLKDGSTVELNLVVEGKDGKKETLALKVPVKAMAMGGGMDHGQHKH